MLKITKIKLTDIRCFSGFEIDLNKTNGANSAVIAGNNGSGKTAILRSIAMGLCDPVSAGSLLRELQGDFIRKSPSRLYNIQSKNKRNGRINIELIDSSSKLKYKIETIIKTRDDLGFEIIEQKLSNSTAKNIEPHEFPWEKIFVVGYGAGLRTEGGEEYAQYFSADSVYSLFKYSHTLQNPELVWYRLRDIGESKQKGKLARRAFVEGKIEESILSILDFDDQKKIFKNSISLEGNGLYVSGPWGRQNLNVLGDGHRALTNLVMDILGWQLLKQNEDIILREFKTGKEEKAWRLLNWDKIDGIVIVDEIEKHLHPKLQRLVISKLHKIFPKIQFIFSTHSPLCVGGVADVATTFTIFRTMRGENNKFEIEEWGTSPAGMTADQILEHIFGVPYINESTLNDIERYGELYLREHRDRAESAELRNLRKKLQAHSASLVLEQERKFLQQQIEQMTKNISEIIGKRNDKTRNKR